MNPMILIALTAVLVVVRVVRLAPVLRSRAAEPAVPARHPLVLLVGSLLSLMALVSILRFVPEAERSWPLFFHVGFICLWLLLGIAADGAPPEPESEDERVGR